MNGYEINPEASTVPAGAYQPQQKRYLALNILGGLGLGFVPFGITLTYTLLVLKIALSNPAWACQNLMTGSVGFLWVSPVMLVTAIIGLFFKQTRVGGIIAIIVWALTTIPAFFCFFMMAFASDGCMRYVFFSR